ncbi:MAG: carboxypeptidase-like regulatory domain-containing protein [Candidatus Thermoplasmatota archaeon]|nr:carboxypeptidase-like regulatory domain-containing protein [Candidatus Thermoplasmatota archaeon]MEE2647957.1 carboxypeptidase-like regulatory domain-containing protein [Candidatus Thermoplasmatota archaeon]
MSEEVGEEATYLDEVVEETPLLFASSETVLTIEDPNLHPIGKATAIFLLFTCLLGFLNGLDYASPTDGLVRPDEFVYRLALTAPDDTATFTGSVVDESGAPLVNATVYLSWLDDGSGMWVSEENFTDENGRFGFEELDPGLIRVDIIVYRDDHRDVFSNRVLLSPPALIEPIGFTDIDFQFPSAETFAQQPCEGNMDECEIRTVDRTPSQMDHPLMDPSAATGYVLVGFAFMGLALIAAGFSVWALKAGSVVLLRTASVVAFFTMGHYYSACVFGLLAFVLTFAVPRRQIPLT